MEALLGKAKFFEKNKKYEEALEVLSELCVINKTFWPAHIEKAKVHISNGEWDQALESLTTVLSKDKNNVEALRIYTYYLLSRENDMELVVEKLDELMAALQMNEEKNADLYYNISRLFARYCGRREVILLKTQQFIDMALAQQPENAAYHSELGT
jgi:tetratricopeptide (TPR) repeat protein